MSAEPSANPGREILVCPDPEAVASEGARTFVRLAREAIQERGRFAVALSGGSTPRRLFEILATPEFKAQLDWEHVHLFWGDERYVPSDDPKSNFRMTLETLLSQVAIPPANVHRIRTELSPAEAVATNYEAEIARSFASAGYESPGKFPAFDLIFLGLGKNAHTASLFPFSKALQEDSHLVTADYVSEVGMWRITMTAALINAARNLVFLVCGKDKAQVVRDVLVGDYDPERRPAQLIQPTRGQVTWIIEVACASELPKESYRTI